MSRLPSLQPRQTQMQVRPNTLDALHPAEERPPLEQDGEHPLPLPNRNPETDNREPPPPPRLQTHNPAGDETPQKTRTEKPMRHRWIQVGDLLRCTRCGLEVKPYRVKKGGLPKCGWRPVQLPEDEPVVECPFCHWTVPNTELCIACGRRLHPMGWTPT